MWRMVCLSGFYSSQVNSIVVDGPIVKENAVKIALKMGIEFKCSNEWLQCFKEWWNIAWQAMSRETTSTDIGMPER
jgi:hypothetical protein